MSFHIDRTKARTTAWAVDWEEKGEDVSSIVLARWTFIYPAALRKAALFMKKRYGKLFKGFNCAEKDRIFLSKIDIFVKQNHTFVWNLINFSNIARILAQIASAESLRDISQPSSQRC